MRSKHIRAWLAVAFPAGILFALPGLAVAHEHNGAPERFVDGTLEIVHIDEIDQAQSRFVYYLLTDEGDGPGKSGAALKLRFERTPPASLKTGDRLNVRGRAVGRNLWVDDIAAADQDGSTATPQETLAESTVASPRSSIVILVNIAGTTTWTNSHITTAENAMFYNSNSVDNIYADASFNQTGFPDTAGTVVAPVTVNKISGCPVYDYAAAADTAASAAGANLSLYQHRIYIIPGGSTSDCNWLALGNVGSYGYTGMLRSWSTTIDSSALAHELGHNVGWHHAATDTNNNGFNLSESTDVEYGDYSDTMGYCCTEKKFNAVHMDQIGWYDNQPGAMLTVAGNGDYTLVPLGTDPTSATGPQILKVSKPDTGEVYYLSYRLRTGIDTGIPTSFADRLNIHHASENGIWSYFIKALSDGQFFDDPVNGLTIVQNSHDANGVNITISYDSCLPSNPTVSVSPATQTVDGNTLSVDYNVTVSNDDSLGCDPATFALSNDIGGAMAGSVQVSPNTSSNPMVLTVNAELSDGDHNFSVTAQRGADLGSGSGTLTVDSTAPSAPSNQAAVQKKVKGRQSIEVTWNASSDSGGTGVDHYEVSRDGQWIGNTTSLKFADSSGSLADPHAYSIVAADEVGNDSAAAVANFVPGGGGSGPGKGGGKGKKK